MEDKGNQEWCVEEIVPYTDIACYSKCEGNSWISCTRTYTNNFKWPVPFHHKTCTRKFTPWYSGSTSYKFQKNNVQAIIIILFRKVQKSIMLQICSLQKTIINSYCALHL